MIRQRPSCVCFESQMKRIWDYLPDDQKVMLLATNQARDVWKALSQERGRKERSAPGP